MDERSARTVVGVLVLIAIAFGVRYGPRLQGGPASDGAAPASGADLTIPADCRMRLESVAPPVVAAGDEVILQGRFGKRADFKLPVINAGGSNDLEVLEWRRTRIRARVPHGLGAGLYRVGVYCAPQGRAATMSSSGFADLRIVPIAIERPN